MTVYMLLLASVFFGCLISFFVTSKLFKTSMLIFSVSVLILFTGTRLDVGFDYGGYRDIFEAVHQGVFPSGVEYGFLVFVKVFSSHAWLIFYTALITLVLKGYVIHFLSPLSFFSLSFYVCTSLFLEDMGQIRQSLAIGIGAVGCLFWFKRSWFFGFILFVISVFFHFSCVVFMVVPVLIFLPFNALTGLLFLVFGTPLFILIGFERIVDLFMVPVKYFSSGLAAKYVYYNSIGWLIDRPPLFLSPGDIWRIFVSLLCLLFWRRFVRGNRFGREIFSIFLFGTVIQPMLRDIDGAARIVRPLLFFEVIVAAQLLVLLKGNVQRVIVSCFVFIFLFGRSSSTLRDPRFAEYKTILVN